MLSERFESPGHLDGCAHDHPRPLPGVLLRDDLGVFVRERDQVAAIVRHEDRESDRLARRLGRDAFPQRVQALTRER